jgi:hypothetical protein
VELILVRLKYTDDENDIDEGEEFTFTSDDKEEKQWLVFKKDPKKKTYQWQADFYMTDGSVRTTKLATKDNENLILVLPAR